MGCKGYLYESRESDVMVEVEEQKAKDEREEESSQVARWPRNKRVQDDVKARARATYH
jgi:hypothetical protein